MSCRFEVSNVPTEVGILCMQCQEKSPMALLGKVFRLLVTGTEAPSYINTLSGCSTAGLGANHPHLIQFLPVMSAVSFDPFSVTLCLPSWYDFSLLYPVLLFPLKQTTLMRNSSYWWTERLLITLYVNPSDISPPLPCCYSSEGGARALLCNAVPAAAGCLWSVWPPKEGSRGLAPCGEHRSTSLMSWTLPSPLITSHIHLPGGGGEAE